MLTLPCVARMSLCIFLSQRMSTWFCTFVFTCVSFQVGTTERAVDVLYCISFLIKYTLDSLFLHSLSISQTEPLSELSPLETLCNLLLLTKQYDWIGVISIIWNELYTLIFSVSENELVLIILRSASVYCTFTLRMNWIF